MVIAILEVLTVTNEPTLGLTDLGLRDLDNPVEGRLAVELEIGRALAAAVKQFPNTPLEELARAQVLHVLRYRFRRGRGNPCTEAGATHATEQHAKLMSVLERTVAQLGAEAAQERARELAGLLLEGLVDDTALKTPKGLCDALEGVLERVGPGRPAGAARLEADRLMDVVERIEGPVLVASLRGSPYNFSNPAKFAREAQKTERGRRDFRMKEVPRRLMMLYVGTRDDNAEE